MTKDTERTNWLLDYRRKRVIEFMESAIQRLESMTAEVRWEFESRKAHDFKTPEDRLDRFDPDDDYFNEVHVLYKLLHTVQWGIANMGLDRIPWLTAELERAKADARYAAEAEAEPEVVQ